MRMSAEVKAARREARKAKAAIANTIAAAQAEASAVDSRIRVGNVGATDELRWFVTLNRVGHVCKSLAEAAALVAAHVPDELEQLEGRMFAPAAREANAALLWDDDMLAIDSGRGYENFYKVGTVRGSARRYRENPVDAFRLAELRGHETFFVYALGVSLTAWVDVEGNRERAAARRVSFGDTVTICDGAEVRTFVLRPDRNDNVKLERVGGKA